MNFKDLGTVGFKELAGYLFGVATFFLLLAIAIISGWPSPVESGVNLALLVLGGGIGWTLGIFLTPANNRQKELYNTIEKFGATALGGFVLGASDFQEIGGWLTGDKNMGDLRGLLFAACFVIGFLMTYIGREDPEDS